MFLDAFPFLGGDILFDSFDVWVSHILLYCLTVFFDFLLAYENFPTAFIFFLLAFLILFFLTCFFDFLLFSCLLGTSKIGVCLRAVHFVNEKRWKLCFRKAKLFPFHGCLLRFPNKVVYEFLPFLFFIACLFCFSCFS